MERILIGGNATQECLRLISHKASCIGVVTWASSVPEETFDELQRQFRSHGVDATHIDITSLDSPALLSQKLRATDSIFFSGGYQGKIIETAPHALLRHITNRSRYGGTSAGSMFLSNEMICDGEIMSGARADDLPIIDTHFWERDRMGRLENAVRQTGTIAIGIDEGTALCIAGDTAQVYGGSVYVVTPERRHPRQQGLLYSRYTHGDTFDRRQFLYRTRQ